MIRKLHRYLMALALASVTLPAMAVPARPGILTYTQPDGSEVKLSLHGDEHFHYLQDEQGYLVAKQDDGWYRILDNSGMPTQLVPMQYNARTDNEKAEIMSIRPQQTFEALKARNLDLQRARMAKAPAMYGAPKRISGAKWDNADGHDLRAIPTDGERPVLVVLVNFSDLKWSFAADPQAEMTAMLNEPGYSRNNCTGSVRDYFLQSSNGIYQPRFDVYGPVELPKSYSYYGRNAGESIDVYAYEMVTDACALLDSEVDFSIYDTNGDGYVDNVYVFYAGFGENEGVGDDYVWPHAYDIHWRGQCPEHDRVKIDHYACSNELTTRSIDGNIKTHSGIGTFCHEFSHVLGLPDLYTTVYNDAFTPDEFSLMDRGSYNNNARTPPLYSIYEKYALEWEKPIDITEGAEVTMVPTVDGGKSYRITIDPTNPKEYYLFENRQQHGQDSYIPGHGMLVWHIDYDQSTWDYNVVNNTPEHQHVDIVEADGRADDGSRAGDPFPGVSSRSEFTATAEGDYPVFKNWNGKATTLPLTNIGEDLSGAVSFRVSDGGNTDSPLYVGAPKAVLSHVSDNSLSFKWEPVAGANRYYINVLSMYLDDIAGSLETVLLKDYTFANIGDVNEITLNDLTPGMSYQVTLYAASENNLSSASQGVYTTFATDMEDVIPLLEVTPGDTYANLNWFEVNGAENYEATVATRVEGERQTGESVNWDNRKYPSDWSFAGGSFDTDPDYVGESEPSLRMNNGTALITGIYDHDINAFEFWARSNVENGNMSLSLYAVEPNYTLTPLGDVNTLPCTKEGTTISFSDLPAGIHQLMLVYNRRTAGMTINIDDLKIFYAGDIKDTPVGAYDAYPVSGTSLKAEGLDPLSPYVAYIRSIGKDGSRSAMSKAVKFITVDPAGIDGTFTDESGAFTYADGVVTCTRPMNIYTLAGIPVAVHTAGSVLLPAKGIYLVHTEGKTYKIVY